MRKEANKASPVTLALMATGIVVCIFFVIHGLQDSSTPAVAPTSTTSAAPALVPAPQPGAATVASPPGTVPASKAPEPSGSAPLVAAATEADLAPGANPFMPLPGYNPDGTPAKNTAAPAQTATATARPGFASGKLPGSPYPIIPVGGPTTNGSGFAVVEPELVGTLLGDTPSGVFKVDQQILTVAQGAKVMGWKVVSIQQGAAVLQGMGRTLRLKTGTLKPADAGGSPLLHSMTTDPGQPDHLTNSAEPSQHNIAVAEVKPEKMAIASVPLPYDNQLPLPQNGGRPSALHPRHVSAGEGTQVRGPQPDIITRASAEPSQHNIAAAEVKPEKVAIAAEPAPMLHHLAANPTADRVTNSSGASYPQSVITTRRSAEPAQHNIAVPQAKPEKIAIAAEPVPIQHGLAANTVSPERTTNGGAAKRPQPTIITRGSAEPTQHIAAAKANVEPVRRAIAAEPAPMQHGLAADTTVPGRPTSSAAERPPQPVIPTRVTAEPSQHNIAVAEVKPEKIAIAAEPTPMPHDLAANTSAPDRVTNSSSVIHPQHSATTRVGVEPTQHGVAAAAEVMPEKIAIAAEPAPLQHELAANTGAPDRPTSSAAARHPQPSITTRGNAEPTRYYTAAVVKPEQRNTAAVSRPKPLHYSVASRTNGSRHGNVSATSPKTNDSTPGHITVTEVQVPVDRPEHSELPRRSVAGDGPDDRAEANSVAVAGPSVHPSPSPAHPESTPVRPTIHIDRAPLSEQPEESVQSPVIGASTFKDHHVSAPAKKVRAQRRSRRVRRLHKISMVHLNHESYNPNV